MGQGKNVSLPVSGLKESHDEYGKSPQEKLCILFHFLLQYLLPDSLVVISLSSTRTQACKGYLQLYSQDTE